VKGRGVGSEYEEEETSAAYMQFLQENDYKPKAMPSK
jgi:hypothetical protein